VLVIQLARLGDLIQTIPLLRALKPQRGVELTLLVDSRIEKAARSIDSVDEVIALDFRLSNNGMGGDDLIGSYRISNELLSPLRGRSFDVVYNLNYSVLNGVVLSQLNYREILGFIFTGKSSDFRCSPAFRILFNQSHHRRYARVHLSDLFRLLADGFSPVEFPLWKVRKPDLDFAANIVERLRNTGYKRIIALHLGAGAEIRKWGAEKSARMVNSLRSEGEFGFIIVGTDKEEARDFSGLVGKSEGIIDLTGKTDLTQLAGVLSEVDLMIGTDSGPLQLAAGVGTRTLGLYFASALVYETGPLGKGHTVIQGNLECAPCDEESPECDDYRCRDLIMPEFVAEAALRILNQDWEGLANCSIPEGVRLFSSEVDEWGQLYRALGEDRDDDPAGFYRELWFRVIRDGIKIEDEFISRIGTDDIESFEGNLWGMGEEPLFRPLAHHYLLVRADEGSAAAVKKMAGILGLIANGRV